MYKLFFFSITFVPKTFKQRLKRITLVELRYEKHVIKESRLRIFL